MTIIWSPLKWNANAIELTVAFLVLSCHFSSGCSMNPTAEAKVSPFKCFPTFVLLLHLLFYQSGNGLGVSAQIRG